ncbi:class I SAM-dependent methyltransferase [Streptomyces sp. TM32]|uniref:daptide-type RiPP biosynthesis methyltransferase n=1 Tax=Streptomyces sp. TM32 TaxID=1652669 RepID=UPI00101097BA|nr:daptide-type RiPP biosynthesis methyltransferase [Streptomyces sp. TM32]RXS69398.1 class I SAM-dependent methyltransferase [Streptomyces sp. TM32]
MAKTAEQPTGAAGRLVGVFGDSLPVQDIYSPEGSRMYHALTQGDRSEIREILRVARGGAGPVLDLACGAGRLTLPLRALRHDIVALDSSAEMLRLLQQSLGDTPAAGPRVELVEADMTAFSLGRHFGLVVLGATSVTLLDRRDRGRLFARVADHLSGDGRFLLTTLEPTGTSGQVTESVQLVIGENGEHPALHLLTEHLDTGRNVRSISVLRQTVTQGAVVKNELFTSRTHVVTVDELRGELATAGLRLLGRYPVAGDAAHDYRVSLLECAL